MAADTPSALDRAAGPVLRFVDHVDYRAKAGEKALIDEAAKLLGQFEAAARRGGASEVTVKPARYALAVLLDQRARQNKQIELHAWSVLARRLLFEGRDMSLDRIRDFRDTAARQGEAFSDLEAFLSSMIARAEERRQGPKRAQKEKWGLMVGGFIVALLLALAGYAGFLEYRYHARLIREFDQQALTIGLDRPQEGAQLVQRLNALREVADRAADAAARAPLKRSITLPFGDSEAHAVAAYHEAVNRQVPGAVAKGIETVLATEGDGLTLYDSLRAWSVLTGAEEWQPGYLAGWLEDHGGRAAITGLSRHIATLDGPSPDIQPTDTIVMDQAQFFAAETSEPDRAWLELLRSDEMRALPDWQPAKEVPGIDKVLLRRSGTDVTEGIPGLFTQDGWDYARKFGVGVSVQRARAVAPEITGQTLPPNNRTPDLLMDRLHRETIAFWKDWLADLRVQPFAERETAIIVSGALAQAENPLSDLLGQVWQQVGGNDRGRTHDQQLVLAREFGPTIQYVQQGRMAEIARLFSSLNVALGAIDVNAKRGSQRLMSIQDRARSIAALKSAPRIVVQIAEDVLAQSAQPSAEEMAGNPLVRNWQQQVLPLCQTAVDGHYPFQGGADAAPADVIALFGAGGAFPTYLQQNALPFLETGESPWRWKPEARFAGLQPESAAFLERGAQIAEGLIGPSGTLDHTVTLAALAERGQTMFAIGGQAVPVRATGDPAILRWPGPNPDLGIEVAFRDAADAARITHIGPWALLRLTDGLRLRLRDGGQRALLDLRNESGRVFLEMGFDDALNPISVRNAVRGFACPPSL